MAYSEVDIQIGESTTGPILLRVAQVHSILDPPLDFLMSKLITRMLSIDVVGACSPESRGR